MSKIDDTLRIEWTAKVEKFFTELGEEVMHEKDNILWLPTVDSEGNDKWIKINVQVPSKVDADCDGYAHQQAYELAKAEKVRKEKEKAEAKAKKIASDKAKREAKAKEA